MDIKDKQTQPGFSGNSRTAKIKTNLDSRVSFVGDINRSFGRLAKKAGFIYFAIMDVSNKSEGWIRPTFLANDLSEELLDDLIDTGENLGRCSVFDLLDQTDVPFGWKMGFDAVTGEAKIPGQSEIDDQFDLLFHQHNINSGYCVPIVSPTGKRGAVFYLGLDVEKEAVLPELAYQTTRLYEATSHHLANAGTRKPSLSSLEKECIRRLVEGYEQNLIAEKIGLSDYSVAKIFNSIVQKAGARNLPQAVLYLYLSGEVAL